MPTTRSTRGTRRLFRRSSTVWRKVSDLAALDARFTPYAEAREAVKSQLEDLAFFLRSYASDIEASPARLQDVEDRLAALERLKKKHGPTLADVASTLDRLRRELGDIETRVGARGSARK